MKKNLLLSGAVFALTMGVVCHSQATFITHDLARQMSLNPMAEAPGAGTYECLKANAAGLQFLTKGLDIGRIITGIVQSIITLTGDGEAHAQLIATQEENNKNATGSGGSAATTDTTQGSLTNSMGKAGDSEFSGSSYTYVKNSVLDRMGNIGYAPIKSAASSGNRDSIRATVISEFFADPKKSSQKTTEYQEKIRKKRSQYIQEAANRHITLGYRVKGYIQNDLSVISSVPLTGDGELGAIAVDAHTLEQMVKMELVDLALQIEMMEADAIQFMMHQPVELMNETK